MMHNATDLASPFFMDYANTFTLGSTIAQEGFDFFTRASEEHFPVVGFEKSGSIEVFQVAIPLPRSVVLDRLVLAGASLICMLCYQHNLRA